jgi:hypothetical protein
MMTDLDGQIEVWKATGGPPPNTEAWKKLAGKDATWDQLYGILFKAEHVHDAYYFRSWPIAHKAYSDTLIRAMSGSKQDIPNVLSEGAQAIRRIAAGQ